MGELLGAIGLAWPRLLLYPGGLSALALAWLLGRWGRAGGVASIDMLPPLLALSLLPLPPAADFPYGIDLVLALALLGWPRLRRLAAAGALADEGLRGLLPGYGLLLLGATAMGAGAGGVELARLLRAPATPPGWGLLLGGAGLWLAGQARLRLAAPGAGLAASLGELGLLWVGALPILAMLAAGLAGRLPAGWAAWALPPLALLIAAAAVAAALGWGRRRGPGDPA